MFTDEQLRFIGGNDFSFSHMIEKMTGGYHFYYILEEQEYRVDLLKKNGNFFIHFDVYNFSIFTESIRIKASKLAQRMKDLLFQKKELRIRFLTSSSNVSFGKYIIKDFSSYKKRLDAGFYIENKELLSSIFQTKEAPNKTSINSYVSMYFHFIVIGDDGKKLGEYLKNEGLIHSFVMLSPNEYEILFFEDIFQGKNSLGSKMLLDFYKEELVKLGFNLKIDSFLKQ